MLQLLRRFWVFIPPYWLPILQLNTSRRLVTSYSFSLLELGGSKLHASHAVSRKLARGDTIVRLGGELTWYANVTSPLAVHLIPQC